MQFRIHFDQNFSPGFYRDYCEFLFDRIIDTICCMINPLKYRVREKSVIESSVIKWVKVPKSINLIYYVKNCLEMVKIKGDYIIRVRDDMRVSNSLTSVKTLIKLLEYGNEKIRPYPVIRVVFTLYSDIYKDLVVEFMKERMLQ